MVPADAEAIHAIHGMCLQRTLLGRYTREQIEAWMAGRTPQGYLRAAEAGERFFVADEGGAVAGSAMGKAAALLNTTQSAISRSIADLENTMGVRLLDRSHQGVEATNYGRALLKRSIAVFDELKQSVRDIEFLADPTTGQISIACSSAIAFTLIPHVIERFVKRYPRAVLQFDEVASASATRNFPELRDRKYDLILTRGLLPTKEHSSDDLNVETLFDDPLVIAAGIQSKWRPVAARLILLSLSTRRLGSCSRRRHGITSIWRRSSTREASPCRRPAWKRCPCRSLPISLPAASSLPRCQSQWCTSIHSKCCLSIFRPAHGR